MYTREICDRFDVGGKRRAEGEIDAQVLAWALSRWRCYAQVENTREKLASHSPGTNLPSSPRQTRMTSLRSPLGLDRGRGRGYQQQTE